MSPAFLTAKCAKTAKVCMSVSPRSYRSRCSRFMILKRSVRCNFYRETLENRKSLYGLFLLVRAVRVVRGSWNSKGVSVGIFTAKCAKTEKVCLSAFPRSYRSRCSRFIEFIRNAHCNFHRERRENRERLYVCFSSFAPLALFAVHGI